MQNESKPAKKPLAITKTCKIYLMKVYIIQHKLLYTGGTVPLVPLFATLPPFRNTFSESLGVAKWGTTGVLWCKMKKTFIMSNSSISQFIQILLFSVKSQIISTTGKDENESQIKLGKSIYATSAYDWTKEQTEKVILISLEQSYPTQTFNEITWSQWLQVTLQPHLMAYTIWAISYGST